DFPIPGLWSGNISWSNISQSELIKSRLASFQPPVFIESITQTEANNGSFSNQSVIFQLNITNENPLFTYYNITPFILGNFSSYNISAYWDPPLLTNLTTGKNSTFSSIYFKINCSEGYYDAIAQEVSLDYRITTQNVTIETYTENQTVIETINETIIEFENQTVIETINETIIEIENQTSSTIIMTQGLTNVVKYSYNRQVFDTLKWAGFFISLALLMSFLAVYISAHAFRLRNLAKRFRSRIFSDQSALELALQSEGISVAPEDLSNMLESTVDLDQFGENLFHLTGKKLSPEDLIRLTSGANTDKIISRLSYVTGFSPDEIARLLGEASSIESLIHLLNLDEERFLDIITRDEQVLSFQAQLASFITPMQKEISDIISNENVDVIRFRSRLKTKIN
ncbi:MAG: hypothetical protein ACW964_18885, partial [Candidatus Hodarchaeales archaeon]